MLDSPLSQCVDRAIARLPYLCPEAPFIADALVEWTTRLSSTGRARDYFDGGRAVMVLLPWWLEKRVRPTPDIAFQELLVESTVSAYYFSRIIDDLMDEDAAEARSLLPLLGILHANFTRAYARLFPPDEPFWSYFDRYWAGTAEAALREKRLRQIAHHEFTEIAGRKTAGVKIPMAAVCCRYNRLDLLDVWCAFYDKLACWQQMLDDTFDWARDLQHGNPTFFLSEGNRQKRPGESVSGWVVRRGFAWGIDQLAASMSDLRVQAEALESPEVVRFIEYRDAEVRECARELTQALPAVATLADVFEPVDNGPSPADVLNRPSRPA
jgi:hypothetical protein